MRNSEDFPDAFGPVTIKGLPGSTLNDSPDAQQVPPVNNTHVSDCLQAREKKPINNMLCKK